MRKSLVVALVLAAGGLAATVALRPGTRPPPAGTVAVAPATTVVTVAPTSAPAPGTRYPGTTGPAATTVRTFSAPASASARPQPVVTAVSSPPPTEARPSTTTTTAAPTTTTTTRPVSYHCSASVAPQEPAGSPEQITVTSNAAGDSASASATDGGPAYYMGGGTLGSSGSVTWSYQAPAQRGAWQVTVNVASPNSGITTTTCSTSFTVT